jgi:NAD+ kinase
MRVGLLLKRNVPQAIELARDLCAFLAARAVDTSVAYAAHDPPIDLPASVLAGARVVAEEELRAVEMLVVLGGDGTLLHGAELVADEGVPILGVNLGHLGFLTTCPPELACPTLADALEGKLPIERRMRLRVELIRPGGERLVRFACNDADISQGALARLIAFEAWLDDTHITTYRADGLIIATPTGSTAYSLAAGGPILTPALQGMVLTPICPHTLTNRPLVVPSSSRMCVELREPAQHVVLTVDGQWGTGLAQGDRVVVHAANKPLVLFRPADTSYFEVMRSKLHWGERLGDATPDGSGR